METKNLILLIGIAVVAYFLLFKKAPEEEPKTTDDGDGVNDIDPETMAALNEIDPEKPTENVKGYTDQGQKLTDAAPRIQALVQKFPSKFVREKLFEKACAYENIRQNQVCEVWAGGYAVKYKKDWESGGGERKGNKWYAEGKANIDFASKKGWLANQIQNNSDKRRLWVEQDWGFRNSTAAEYFLGCGYYELLSNGYINQGQSDWLQNNNYTKIELEVAKNYN